MASESYLHDFREFVREHEITSNTSTDRAPHAPIQSVEPLPSLPSAEAKVNPAHAAAPLIQRAIADVPRLHPKTYKPLPAPPGRVGGFASASAPAEPKITGRIGYNFPYDFPESSRDTITIEQNRALLEFNANIDGSRECALPAMRRVCAMRVVDAFYLEAVRLKWGANRIDQQLDDFVLSAQIWAGLTHSELKESDEWKQHLVRRVRPPDRSVEAPHGAATPAVSPTSSDGRLEPYSEEWLGSVPADRLREVLAQET